MYLMKSWLIRPSYSNSFSGNHPKPKKKFQQIAKTFQRPAALSQWRLPNDHTPFSKNTQSIAHAHNFP